MDDAISYMTCLAGFVAAFRTASAHLSPGGVLVATPDVTNRDIPAEQDHHHARHEHGHPGRPRCRLRRERV
jgi:hypothetical protein